MTPKSFVGLGLVLVLAGCDGVIVVDRPYRRPPPVVYYQPAPVVVYQPAPVVVAQPAPGPGQPAPVVAQPAPAGQAVPVVVQPAPVPGQPAPVAVQPAPVVVEEGVVYGGVVVAEPAGMADYVFIGGGWYYWHPGLHVWVHANRPGNWRPGAGARVYHGWAEHPVYHR